MVADPRQAHEGSCRRMVAEAAARIEALRDAAERRPGPHRAAMERALDDLRGRCNRAAARVEAARGAPDGAWDVVRGQADSALFHLMNDIDALARRLLR